MIKNIRQDTDYPWRFGKLEAAQNDGDTKTKRVA